MKVLHQITINQVFEENISRGTSSVLTLLPYEIIWKEKHGAFLNFTFIYFSKHTPWFLLLEKIQYQNPVNMNLDDWIVFINSSIIIDFPKWIRKSFFAGIYFAIKP